MAQPNCHTVVMSNGGFGGVHGKISHELAVVATRENKESAIGMGIYRHKCLKTVANRRVLQFNVEMLLLMIARTVQLVSTWQRVDS